MDFCYERNHTAETKLKRLCSLGQFIDFIRFEKNILPDITYQELKYKINLWRTQLKQAVTHQFQQRKVRDTQNFKIMMMTLYVLVM